MNLQSKIRYLRNSLYCLPWKVIAKTKIYRDNTLPIKFVSEDADWAIKTVGENIKKGIDLIKPNQFEITTDPSRIIKKIVHFGSQYMWLNWGQHMSKENYYISTFFHGKYSDGEATKHHIEQFLKSIPRLSKVITASTLVEKRLIDWGVPQKKLVKIPLGVNTKKFITSNQENKNKIRDFLNIPHDAILIGSFQKDGIGWGEGLKPKLIKGPDIFVKTLNLLSKKGLPIYALLTGPSRGYVKEELKKNNIPFYHSFVSKIEDLVFLYQALDIYLITSREEGGPMGLLESILWNSVVTTRVAEDVIKKVFETNEIIQMNLQKKLNLYLKLYKNKIISKSKESNTKI